MQLEDFTKALADQTRLRIVLLLAQTPELCVCELTQALALPQPKISRHLGVLRETGLLLDRKAGLWVHYRLHPELPAWAQAAITHLAVGSTAEQRYQQDQQRLAVACKQSVSCTT